MARRCSVRGLMKGKAEAIRDEGREGERETEEEMDGRRTPIIKCSAKTASIQSSGNTVPEWVEIKNGTWPHVLMCFFPSNAQLDKVIYERKWMDTGFWISCIRQ
jgi:hypothetical protein